MNNLHSQLQIFKDKSNSYTKSPKTFEEQLHPLKDKNLIITNEAKHPTINLQSMGFVDECEEISAWK